MQKVSVTLKVAIDQIGSYPQIIPTIIYPPHFNLGDRVWLVYCRDRIGSYDYYIGQVTISGVRREKRLAGYSGTAWRYEYFYNVSTTHGDDILGKWWETQVSDAQVFLTKQDALDNMRGALLDRLDNDRQRYAKYLAITEATIQKVKDTSIELTYASIE